VLRLRVPYHHGDLRVALLDAAEELVRSRGVDGWSLREASAQVGVSPSAAYHHFASRDALVRALSHRIINRIGTAIRDAAAAFDDPGSRIVAIGQTYVRFALDDPAVWRLAFGVDDPEAPISPHPHDILAAELDRLDLGGAVFLLWAAMHGLATLLADGLLRFDDPAAVDVEAERLVRAVLSGLAGQSGPWPMVRSAYTDRQ
jgi:AcrR family transcriptional regulator